MIKRSHFRERPPEQVRIVVFGATGYIGRYVVQELIKRKYNVVAFARERSGIKGSKGTEEVISEFSGAQVRFGDITDPKSLEKYAFDEQTDVIVSCHASRTGGPKDAWEIDHQASINTYNEGRKAGLQHYILLSAICVQKPLLEFQKAKLAFESIIQSDQEITHSIVRPTAFFKSLSGQFENCQKGLPFIMFGGGKLTSCKPISEQDLAIFISNCIHDEEKINKILPIGGPGPALNAREQGEMLFRVLRRKPWLISLPIELIDIPIKFLEQLSYIFPQLKDTAEFGRIGRYYATESMLIWDENKCLYDSEATPSFGEDTLEKFFKRIAHEGIRGQELGDAAVF